MKTKEEIEKEFDEKFAYPMNNYLDEYQLVSVKSHLSKIRKDDIDAMERLLKGHEKELSDLGEYETYGDTHWLAQAVQYGKNEIISDLLAHLQAIKEKV